MDAVVAMGMPTSNTNILKCTALGGAKRGRKSCRGVLFYYGAEWSFNQMPSTSKEWAGFRGVGGGVKMYISNNFKLFLHQRASKKSRYVRQTFPKNFSTLWSYMHEKNENEHGNGI